MTSPYTRGDGAGAAEDQPFRVMQQAIEERRDGDRVSEKLPQSSTGRFDVGSAAGVRQIPLSDAAVKLLVEWRVRVKRTEPESLMFSTWSGKPIRRTTSCVSGPFQRATLWDCNA